MDQERFVPSGAVIHLLAALRDTGIDTSPVTDSLSGDYRRLLGGNSRIRVSEIQQAYRVAMQLQIPEGFWLRLGCSFSVHNYHLDLSNWILTGRNFAEIMPRLHELYGQRASTQVQALELNASDSDADADGWLVQPLVVESLMPGAHRAAAELGAGSLVRGFSSLLGGSDLVFRFFFAYDEPPYRALYQELLGDAVEFDASASEVHFPREYFFRTFPSSDPRMHEYYERQLDDLFLNADESGELIARVENLLLRSQQGFPSMAQLCQTLHVGERALRRALKRQGTTFRKLLTEIKMNRAKYYLAHTNLSIETVAEHLDYSDYSNFRRAFQAHCGTSPSRFRRRSADHSLNTSRGLSL